tara:strand:+ start:253570 stop:254370 length:801 start_codon:yes stop_codon:yes gene_type:complete
MGARVLVQSGITSGSVHWIERKVVRIGSDPAMEITIPSDQVAPHALTLEYRDSGYHVHNRSPGMIHLGGSVIAQNASGRWADADLLEIAGSVQLALELDDDAAPSPRPAAGTRNDENVRQPIAAAQPTHALAQAASVASSQVAGAAPKKSDSTITQIAVIIVCVVLGGLLLARDRMRKEGKATQDVPSFQQIVQQGLSDGALSDGSLLRQFQFAEAAVIRGHEEKARRHYSLVRSRLLYRQSAEPEDRQALQNDMLRYVEFRLGQL